VARLTILTGQEKPILHQKTQKVPKVTKEIVKLLKEMEETVSHPDVMGAGLAAPQVGRSERVCIALINGNFTPLVNPEITWRSEETDTMEEGCLSLPGIWLQIMRPIAVAVQFLDLQGKQQQLRLQGFDARVVQHEVDHLDGVLILDRHSSPSGNDDEQHGVGV
jgi:peptide deformylase